MLDTTLLIAAYLIFVGAISSFIIYFDRRKFASPRMAFYYLMAFFVAGALMLAINTVAIYPK